MDNLVKELGAINATLRKLIKLIEVSTEVELTSGGYQKKQEKQ